MMTFYIVISYLIMLGICIQKEDKQFPFGIWLLSPVSFPIIIGMMIAYIMEEK